MGWAAVSASLYTELGTGLIEWYGTDANSCRVYMHRGLGVLHVGSPSSGATVRLSASGSLLLLALHRGMRRWGAHKCCGLFDH